VRHPPPWFRETLALLLDRQDLNGEQARSVVDYLLGEPDFADAAALLVALRMKGETATELAAAAAALRERMTPFPTGRDGVLDTCGPGGTGDRTFNISTAAAIVAAGAGVPVVKHGNRAVSSLSGSADVLRELGLQIESGPAWARRCLDAASLAFCFAPHFHPILARLGDLRRRLGVRTIFNSLGPLANPAAAPYQLLGLGRPEQLDPMAGALAILGTRHAVVVCGADGFDEVSLSGPTAVREVRGGTITSTMWTPKDFGMEPCRVDDLRVADAAGSAAIIRDVLDDRPGPARRIVVANAAAALLAAERVTSLRDGVQVAEDAIRTGSARQVVERLRACSTDLSPRADSGAS
jgi:anthranilate phosphoribosyltransferase